MARRRSGRTTNAFRNAMSAVKNEQGVKLTGQERAMAVAANERNRGRENKRD